MANQAVSMEPLSARIPSDLYGWLAQLQVEGATTNSDKLRVLLGQLKRQHDGAFDYVAAHAWARDTTARLREALVRTEGRSGRHSEVLNVLLDHLTTSLAMVVSDAPGDEAAAAKLEDALVRRAFALSEALLRQATTVAAAAYDPGVVRRHMAATVELAATISNNQGG
ncbi:hypothetical protein [Pseudorhodoferax sp.]|uniref:hypothetical protein n=1 Tax=Pseudorhodoferax sp. TaxID=1993553 RepID=UPI002DD673EF|nr:hypothetical protein [Pseudorhodoferax sp.]